MKYEKTQLRKVYRARMNELWPGWPLAKNEMKGGGGPTGGRPVSWSQSVAGGPVGG